MTTKRRLALRNARPGNAFTLVELLVVVAIIAILASLLLPALARGRAAAVTTECRQNLRDVGLAMRMWVDEFNAYPTDTGGGITLFNDIYGLLNLSDWKYPLQPYLGIVAESESSYLKMRKLRCPQILRTADGARGNGQYAYNGSGTSKLQSKMDLGLGGSDWSKATPESRVVAPASMIAAGDIAPGRAQNPPPSFPPGKIFSASGAFDICSTNRSLWPGTSHTGQANMLFCDGHVESARQSMWISTNYAARSLWNNDHEPHPETWQRP